MIITRRYVSPAGELLLGALDNKLCMASWVAGTRHAGTLHTLLSRTGLTMEDGYPTILQRAIKQLDEYFNGTRREFDIPVDIIGTEFQCTVRRELLNIPYGETISYAELARRIGNPKAVRAVASANATNPLSIFVPCHRVIGSDNRLTGYGGGLPAKKILLELEGVKVIK